MPRIAITGGLPIVLPPPGISEAWVSVKTGTVTEHLRAGDVRSVFACENYTEVALELNRRVLVRRTMREWAELLPPAQFARVHRGLFVNLGQIGRVDRATAQSTKIHFIGDAQPSLEIKRRHWPALRSRLDVWRLVHRPAALPGNLQKSIAVLPFVSLNRDPADGIFSDGVSEELLNCLAKMPGLRVAARTSSHYFKGKNTDIREIARQLGVDFIVEGSVRRTGARVRITAQLVGAVDGLHAWSDNFDRELTDLFAAQHDIARVIAENLQLKLGPTAPAPAQTTLDAHWLALEGRHFWNLRTPDGLDRAEKAFAGALASNPDFARAQAGLADVCVVRAMYRLADGEPAPSDDLLRARTAAQRAIALDPSLGEPHATLGFVCFHEGRLADARRHFPKALALNPSYATGFQFYAWTLAALGELDRALEIYRRAIALDPLSFINVDRYAAMLALAGQFPEALAANERAASLRPDAFVGNLSQRATILAGLGRRDEAVSAARAVRQTTRNGPFRRNSDADALSVLNQAGLAREAGDYGREILAPLGPRNPLRGFVLAALGRFDEAMPSLAHTPTILQPFLYWSRMWDPVRGQTAFLNLIEQLGRAGEYRRAQEHRESPAIPAVSHESTCSTTEDVVAGFAKNADSIERFLPQKTAAAIGPEPPGSRNNQRGRVA